MPPAFYTPPRPTPPLACSHETAQKKNAGTSIKLLGRRVAAHCSPASPPGIARTAGPRNAPQLSALKPTQHPSSPTPPPPPRLRKAAAVRRFAAGLAVLSRADKKQRKAFAAGAAGRGTFRRRRASSALGTMGGFVFVFAGFGGRLSETMLFLGALLQRVVFWAFLSAIVERGDAPAGGARGPRPGLGGSGRPLAARRGRGRARCRVLKYIVPVLMLYQ